MQRFAPILMLLVFLTVLSAGPAAAGLFGDDVLVTIDGTDYTPEDFKRWWEFWQEPEQPLPKTPDPYIDWLLLAEEGKRMEMDEAPGFKRQTRVFLQSRTLLMLKYDAVDSQIQITDAEINQRYQEQFQPRWQVVRLEFKDEKAALAAWDRLAGGELTVDELLELDSEAGGPAGHDELKVRPRQVDEGWVSIFKATSPGEVVNPEEHNKGHVLYYLKEQKAGDEEDLDVFRESIRREIWKEKEDELTRKLILELIDKYEVEINQERLAALDHNAPDDSFTDEPVITSSRENVSEKEFMAVIDRLMASRPTAGHAAADEELFEELKQETAHNIIAQSVTNWESIDRNYEEKEPFKWEYQFNYNHRLALAVEQQLFVPKVEVTEAEIRQHYEENAERYTQPTVVKLYIVDETQGPIEKIWADVAVGKPFLTVAKEHLERQVVSQEVPINHLDPEVREVVEKLAVGETSRIFDAQGIRVMVHLTEKTLAKPLPYERVKESIRGQLRRDELKQVRNEYLETLKSRSEIDVREREWKAIQKELGGA